MAAASSRSAAGIALSAASDAALTVAANAVPARSASCSGTGENVGLIAAPLADGAGDQPLLDSGDAICALTEIDPADSPAMVTFCGSPPKAAMLSRTH